MAEWLNVAVSKTVVRGNVPRVRIPLSPPNFTMKPLIDQHPHTKFPSEKYIADFSAPELSAYNKNAVKSWFMNLFKHLILINSSG